MTLQEWIDKYEKKAEELIILPGFSVYFEPEKGFFYWKVTNGVFEVDHTCTNDGKWAYDKAYEMAKLRGCMLLRTQTSRDPAAYLRMYKGTVNFSLSGIRPNGKMYWMFEKEVH